MDIEEQERELEAQRSRQVQLEQEHARAEEERLHVEEKHESLQAEADSKGRKLKQLWGKFRAAQAEIQDLQVEQQQEKEDLLQTVRELTRQLQLQAARRDTIRRCIGATQRVHTHASVHPASGAGDRELCGAFERLLVIPT